MEDKAVRSAGGRLALWVFWLFCLYFCWTLLNDIWLASKISVPSGFANVAVNSSGNWLNTASCIVVLGVVGAILGAIAWYTRPRELDA